MMTTVNSGSSSTPAPSTGASKPKSAEMHPGPGFRMLREIERVDADVVAAFPVFARGVTPIGPLHRGPGEINYPVSVGGIVVHPGDLIAGDLNGVVVVPRESAGELLERLRARAPAERSYSASVAAGQFSNDWVDKALESSGLTP